MSPPVARHVLGDAPPERATVEQRRPLGRDGAQRRRVVGLHQPVAALQGGAVRQEDASAGRESREIGGRFREALGEIARHAEAVLGMADGRRHHGGAVDGAEARQHLAPGGQVAGHADRFQPDAVLAVDGFHVVGPRVGDRPVHVRPGRGGRRGVAVDRGVDAPAEIELGVARAEDPDHHRLDHAEREQRGDGRVDGVAAAGQHLGAGRRGQRVVGHHHAARRAHGLLLGLKVRARAGAPAARGGAGSAHLPGAASQEFQKYSRAAVRKGPRSSRRATSSVK